MLVLLQSIFKEIIIFDILNGLTLKKLVEYQILINIIHLRKEEDESKQEMQY